MVLIVSRPTLPRCYMYLFLLSDLRGSEAVHFTCFIHEIDIVASFYRKKKTYKQIVPFDTGGFFSGKQTTNYKCFLARPKQVKFAETEDTTHGRRPNMRYRRAFCACEMRFTHSVTHPEKISHRIARRQGYLSVPWQG